MQRRPQKPPLGTQVNWAHPLARGLVGCWLVNEAGGDKVYDLSGNKNTGTLTNMEPATDWVAGERGPALDFDASDDYVDVGTNPVLNPEAITMSVWLKARSFPTYTSPISRVLSPGPPNSYNEILIKSTGKLAMYVLAAADVSYDGTGTYTLSVDQWYHLALTYDLGNGLVGYVNALQDGTAGANGALVPGAGIGTSIGTDLNIADREFDGLIDDARIYNRALTPQEIQELYENPYGMFEQPLVWMLPGITTYYETLVGALSSAGILVGKAEKALAGAPTYAGTLVGKGQKNFSGALTYIGVATKEIHLARTILLGASTFIGTVRSKGKKVLSGALASSGILIKKAKTTFVGAVTFVGVSLRKRIFARTILAGALTGSGVLARKAKLRLTGALTSSGILRNRIFKTFTGVWTSAGVLRKKSTRLLIGALTKVGVLRRGATKTLIGAFSSAGTVATAFVGNVILLVGVIGYAGDLYKKAKPILRGNITPSGIISRFAHRILAGALSLVGRLLGAIPQPVTLTLAPRSTTFTLSTRSTTLTLPSRGG